eukprot:CAMPEP_0178897516 /NCGR_PEP_ID=MMETSP0786-20121207/1795_1 /TAXON_ID=186022 /ORGANISM="Thalassionema frauenfeldii, Strain CCMP 1798" /LENGTH=335 /DNA_ID=CAMNT_0020568085 /DNA_START=271 /DNA_END=1274 /DNA_ORIENTATION=-
MIPPLYYMTLSSLSFLVLSFRVLHGKDDKDARRKEQPRVSTRIENMQSREKWLHWIIYLVPLIPASYLLSTEAYNPGFWICTIVSYPLGCGDSGDIPCTRGPSTWNNYRWYLRAVPFLVIFVVTALVLLFFSIFLMLQRRRKQEHHNSTKRLIVKGHEAIRKSGLYLVALLWSYAFYFIRLSRDETTATFDNVQFAITILAIVNENLLGLWITLIYSYFKDRDDSGHDHVRSDTEEGGSTNTGSDNKRHGSIYLDDNTMTTQLPESSDERFGIFDGNTICSDSPWASYLTEGVDDDYCNSKNRWSVLTSEATNESEEQQKHDDAMIATTSSLEGG